MTRKKIWFGITGLLLAVLAVSGGYVYQRFFTIDKATKGKPVDLSSIQAKLTYDGAYNGPLYLTGEKTGSEAPFDQLIEGMDRNGVVTSIAYVGIEADNRAIATDNINTIIRLIKNNPGRFTAFYSPGFGADEIADTVDDELTGIFKTGLEYTHNAVSGGFMKGIGEIEMQAWEDPLLSPKAKQLFDFAAENKLSAMIHISPRQIQDLEGLLKAYPDTTFLLHLFANDLEQASAAIAGLLKRYANLVYTIDADHLMFDSAGQPPIGLLYKYQDQDAEAGAEMFVKDFDSKFDVLLEQAVARYRPVIAAAPDRVTIGTEMSTDYSFDPKVFDRSVKFIRYFIAQQDPGVQEALAIQNAQRIFGKGTVLQ